MTSVAPSHSETPSKAAEDAEADAVGEHAEAGGPVADTVATNDSPSAEHEAGAAPAPIVVAEAANPLGDALAALDSRDYATAKRLFEALGRNDAAEAIEAALKALDRQDYATAQGLFEALKPPAHATPVAKPEAESALDAKADAPQAVETHPLRDPVLAVEPDDRRPAPPIELVKPRGSWPRALAAALALVAVVAAGLLYSTHRKETVATATLPATAPVDPVANPAPAPVGSDDVRAALRALNSELAEAMGRLDRIERETGARLEALGARIDARPSPSPADLSARLEALEKRTGAPAADAGDLAARLDRLEKTAAAAAEPPTAQVADLSARLDRLEKKLAATAASAKPAQTAAKPSTNATRAQSVESNVLASRTGPQRLIPDYTVEAVQGGRAWVDGRYGPQQVARGDFIPGAGRVLRIERRGGEWVVQTSGGVIAGAPPPPPYYPPY